MYCNSFATKNLHISKKLCFPSLYKQVELTGGFNMSSVKCVGIMAAAGGIVTGGMSLYSGMKARKQVIAHAQKVADANGGKIPTGGMTKDGALWDGFTTVDKIKKDSREGIAVGTGITAAVGAVSTAVVSALTLLAKAKIK